MFLAIFVLLCLLSSPALSNTGQVENCTINSDSAANNPQPDIVPYDFAENFTTIELPTDSGARCLDGTNYKFYFTRGTGIGVNNWVFYWQGAAFCGADGSEVVASCYDRLSTEYGTSDSSYWGENGTTSTNTGAWGWFSSMEQYNPRFANWNKVLIISCDGANHMGSLDDPIYYDGTPIYFRGMNNTLGTLAYLEANYDLLNATEVILGGGSSGATASYIWMAYLQDYFPSTVRLTGLPDAGLFVDTYADSSDCYLYRYFMQCLANTLNLSSAPSSTLFRRCKYLGRDDFWKCLIVQYMYKTIDIPVFIINSENDFKQLTNLQGLSCINDGGLQYCDAAERRTITRVREKFLKVIFKIKKNKPHWGFWLRTCFEHTYHFTWGWYGHSMDAFSAESLNSSNIKDALYRWYENAGMNNSANSYIDVIDWLHNPLCRYGPDLYDQDEA